MKLSAKALQKALKGIEIDAALHPGPPELAFDQLLVPLGPDPHGQEMVLQIGVLEGSVPGDPDQENELEETKLQFVQFLILIPVVIEDKCLKDVQAFINLLNSVMELPGFGILERDRMPFFRYTMVCNKNHVDEELFVMTVGLIMHVLDTYLDPLEDIALGKKPLSHFFKESLI
jgi:hypothetical protein